MGLRSGALGSRLGALDPRWGLWGQNQGLWGQDRCIGSPARRFFFLFLKKKRHFHDCVSGQIKSFRVN